MQKTRDGPSSDRYQTTLVAPRSRLASLWARGRRESTSGASFQRSSNGTLRHLRSLLAITTNSPLTDVAHSHDKRSLPCTCPSLRLVRGLTDARHEVDDVEKPDYSVLKMDGAMIRYQAFEVAPVPATTKSEAVPLGEVAPTKQPAADNVSTAAVGGMLSPVVSIASPPVSTFVISTHPGGTHQVDDSFHQT